jgi:hypothetical protein
MSIYKYEDGGQSGGPRLVLPEGSKGEILRTEDGREYVNYQNEQGQIVKVFGSWNDAVDVTMGDDPKKQFLKNTRAQYPISQNEKGEFILDEAALNEVSGEEGGPRKVFDPAMGRQMPVAPVGNLLKQMEQMGEPVSPTVKRGIRPNNLDQGASGLKTNRMRVYNYGGDTDPKKANKTVSVGTPTNGEVEYYDEPDYAVPTYEEIVDRYRIRGVNERIDGSDWRAYGNVQPGQRHAMRLQLSKVQQDISKMDSRMDKARESGNRDLLARLNQERNMLLQQMQDLNKEHQRIWNEPLFTSRSVE